MQIGFRRTHNNTHNSGEYIWLEKCVSYVLCVLYNVLCVLYYVLCVLKVQNNETAISRCDDFYSICNHGKEILKWSDHYRNINNMEGNCFLVKPKCLAASKVFCYFMKKKLQKVSGVNSTVWWGYTPTLLENGLNLNI